MSAKRAEEVWNTVWGLSRADDKTAIDVIAAALDAAEKRGYDRRRADPQVVEALKAVIPCLEDWIKTTGFGEVHRRDSAALAAVRAALRAQEGVEK